MIPQLWSSSKVSYDKDAAFRISHWGPKQKLFYRARQAVQSSHNIHSRMKILSIVKILVDKQFGYGYLKEKKIMRANQKEYTFKEADFSRLHLNDIEDMYLLYAQNKLHHLTGDEQTDIVTTLQFFIRRIVLQKRVEDVQLGVESYQTKLNITMLQVRCVVLDTKEPYTIFYEPIGVVYLKKEDKKYLMRADELYKFGDGTLKKARDKLDYMLHNFELGYNQGYK
ncbi:hypothetical protein Tco_0446695 [Tanacetum coccineum]